MNQNMADLENDSVSALRPGFQCSTPEEQALQRESLDLQEENKRENTPQCPPEAAAFGHMDIGLESMDLQSLELLGDESVGQGLMGITTSHTEEREEGAILEDSTELKLDIAKLRSEKDVLEEAIKQAESQQTQQASLKDCIDELNNDRICLLAETKALQDKLAKLNEKIQPEEKLRQHCMDVEKKIATLRAEKSDLCDEIKFAKSKLVQQAVLKDRCFELDAEKNRLSAENGYIRQNISRMVQKIAENTIWKQKIEQLEKLTIIVEIENRALKEELAQQTREYEAEKLEELDDKQKVQNIEDLKKNNATIQWKIDEMGSKIRCCKAVRKCYKQIIKGDAHVKAQNKKLAKKEKECYNELKKLDDAGKKIRGRVGLGMDVMRAENVRLHKTILAVNEQIANKKMLQAHFKTLEDEQKMLMQSNNNLKKEVLQLEMVKMEQQPLCDANDLMEANNNLLRRDNELLQKEYEDMFFLTNTREVAKIYSEIHLREGRELDRVNKQLTAQTQRHMLP